MESEFRVKNPRYSPTDPSYSDLVISALRKSRAEHPVADSVVGLVPGIGAGQAAMDVTDPEASDFQRMLAVGSVLPGARLAKMLISRLRKPAKVLEKTIPNDFSMWGDLFKTPAKTDKTTVKAANDAYTQQLLREEGIK